MIDTHHLAYAGVLLVFLTGAAIITAAAFLFLGTGFLTALVLRIIKRASPRKLSVKPGKAEAPLSMEEALRQVAAGKAAPTHNRLEAATGNRAPLHLAVRRCSVPPRQRRWTTTRAKSAA